MEKGDEEEEEGSWRCEEEDREEGKHDGEEEGGIVPEDEVEEVRKG